MLRALTWPAVLVVSMTAAADPPAPTAAIERLPQGATSAQIEVAIFDARGYRSAQGLQRIPGQLRFVTAQARVAHGLSPRLAVGIVVPYRVVLLSPQEGSGTFRREGIAGGALFADIGLPAGALLRTGYLRAAKFDDPVLSVSDGIDRLFFTYAVKAPDRYRPWTGWFRGGILAGRERLPEESAYAEGWVQAAAGRRIAPRLDVLLVTGSGLGTDAREQGSFLSKDTSYGHEGGLMLQWTKRPGLRFRASATHSFAVHERFEGLRIALSATARFPSAARPAGN